MFQKPNAVDTPRYEKPNAYDEEDMAVTASRHGSRSSRMTTDSYSSRYFSYPTQETPNTSPPSSPKTTFQHVMTNSILKQSSPTTQTSFTELEINKQEEQRQKSATLRHQRSMMLLREQEMLRYYILRHRDIYNSDRELVYRKLSSRSWTYQQNTLVDVTKGNKKIAYVKRKTFNKDYITIELEGESEPEYLIKKHDSDEDADHDYHSHKNCRRWKLLAEYSEECLTIQRHVLSQIGGDKRDLLEANLIITCCTLMDLLYIAIFAVLSAAQPYLPIYYHDTLNFSSDQIGLVLAIAPFIQSISCPLWTYIVDKKPALHGFIMALTAFLGGAAIMAIMFIGQSSGTLFGIELSNTLLVVVVSSLALGFAFFTLPNMALVDSAVMKILGPNKILYGEQRLWGSVSAALTILVVGQLISYTGNLDTIFYVYAASTLVFIFLAFFAKPNQYEHLPASEEEQQPIQRVKTAEKLFNNRENYNSISDQHRNSVAGDSHFVDLFKTNSLASVHTIREEADEALDTVGVDLGLAISRIASVDQSLASILEHSSEEIPSAQIFTSPRILTFLITTLLFGFVLSIIINFLFLFLSAAHIATIVRCLAYTVLVPDSFITNVIALSLQTLHGIGFGIFWATSVSEMDSFFPPEQRSVAQGILGALHFGLGTGLGALVGGYLYQYLGSAWMFRIAAVVCAANMVIFYIGRLERYNH
ncbi:MFS general substrate transporter [Rhizopus microsporus]|uniref:MFS general substrate transporter n=1 Tax=Rhizopus microsporus TaxID=58291 RepID=A0A1X0S851_RHIZD|nr:MFS general substrate transporter [Rhizopus microsporus]